jgi:hypothetical protein
MTAKFIIYQGKWFWPGISIPYIKYTTLAYTRSISHGTLTVSATFSEPMDPLMITALTFLVKKGTTPVTGIVLYNGQTRTAIFTPSVDLDHSTTYAVTITTGAENLAGTPKASDDVWNFTTSALTGQEPVNPGPAANFAILAGGAQVSITLSSGATIDGKALTRKKALLLIIKASL